jgi:hypothetical protein
VFVIDSLQLFPYSCLQQHTVLKSAYKRSWFYVRDTEFLSEVEVSSDIKIQANEDGSDNGDRYNVRDCKSSDIVRKERWYFLLMC